MVTDYGAVRFLHLVTKGGGGNLPERRPGEADHRARWSSTTPSTSEASQADNLPPLGHISLATVINHVARNALPVMWPEISNDFRARKEDYAV